MNGISPLHRFIIRNSDLLPVAQIAEYLRVSPEIVRDWMNDLGLPEMLVMDGERTFPIILRRNHDLLSEAEIARLIGMPLCACRKLTQEMDFLDVKLGSKPENLPEISAEDTNVAESAGSFRLICSRYFENYDQWEKPFSFLTEFDRPEEQFAALPEKTVQSTLATCMMNSYAGSHGDFLLTGEDYYSEGILSRLRNRGVNAGWMPALLCDLAPSSIFREFGEGHETRLENLRKQVEKASNYGIKIYLYFNEPRFMPEEFFEKYPQAKGMVANQRGYYGMCTSDPQVRDWICEATRFVFQAVPDLGGVVLITASENRTNCYSHALDSELSDDSILDSGSDVPGMCPRCGERGSEQVLPDTANLMYDAVRASGSKAEVIQWLWGWDYRMPLEDIETAVSNLRPEVVVMLDWARQMPFTLFGKDATIIEYTLAYVEPSAFAREIMDVARKQGRKVFSRSSLVSTVEMNALPYIPVMTNVEQLLKELQSHQVDGVLGCWIFGAYPGRNMEMLSRLEEPQPAEFLARKYYGSGDGHALEAWKLFSDGMKYYPSTVSVLYLSAVNPGPGLKFSLEPEPWRRGMVAMATENIEETSDPFGPEVMIKGFREVAKYFSAGLEHLRKAIDQSDRAEWDSENRKDYGICEACMRHLLSAANYSEFIIVRNHWLENQENGDLRASTPLSMALALILEDELKNSEAMLELAKSDSRIGYEGSIGYFYTPVEIIEKIYDLKLGIESLTWRAR